jgi:hypothetical protein
MLLGRTGILNEYFTSPRMFVQASDFESLIQHDTSGTPECDPKGKEKAEGVFNKLDLYDPYMMARMKQAPVQNMISAETRLLKDAPSPETAELGRVQIISRQCEQGNMKFCKDASSSFIENCRILGGYQSSDRTPSEPSRLFLQKLDEANLDGVVIWGLREDGDHSHRYVHQAIAGAVEEALMYSSRRRHICYVSENTGFDLGRELYGDESKGMMARSLVFASPKHMAWSADPGFLTLPVETTSRYIFHGLTPRPHTALKRAGLAVEWESWGDDGNIPVIESDTFVRGEAWKPRPGCVVDQERKTVHCRDENLFVSPWASAYSTEQILSNRENAMSASLEDKTTTLHFVGTVWGCNVQEFIDFTRGCADYGINVFQHGQWLVNTDSLKMNELNSLPNFARQATNDESMDKLMQDQRHAIYAPAFQGDCHLQEDASNSYIADRILNLISIGLYPMTNNPSAFEYLGESEAIVFHANTSQLCGAMIDHQSSQESLTKLMEDVAQEHTYVSRLSSILDFLSSPRELPNQDTDINETDFLHRLSKEIEGNDISRIDRSAESTNKNSHIRMRGSSINQNQQNESRTKDSIENVQSDLDALLQRKLKLGQDSRSSSPTGSPTYILSQIGEKGAPSSAPSELPSISPSGPGPSKQSAKPSSMPSSTPLKSGDLTPLDSHDIITTQDMSMSLSLSMSLFPLDTELRDDLLELDENVDQVDTPISKRLVKKSSKEDKRGERLQVPNRRRRRLIKIRD